MPVHQWHMHYAYRIAAGVSLLRPVEVDGSIYSIIQLLLENAGVADVLDVSFSLTLQRPGTEVCFLCYFNGTIEIQFVCMAFRGS